MKRNSYLKSLYGKGFLPHILFGMSLSFLTAAAQYAVTQHLGVMIDAAGKRPEGILSHFSLMAALLACYLAGNAAFILFTGRTAASFSCRLQSGIGDKVCSARYQAIEQTEDGEVLAIADKDVESLKSWLLLLWRTGALPVNLLLIPVNLFRWCDWKFTLAVLSLIPLNAVISVLIARKLPKYHHNEKNAYADVISSFTSTIQFEMMIKACQLEQIFQEKEKEKLQEHLKQKKKRLTYERLAEVFDRCFGHFSRIFLLLAGAYLILKGDMTLGGLTSIILLAGLVGEGLKTIGSIPANLQNARVGADRLQKLLAMEDEDETEIPSEGKSTAQKHVQKRNASIWNNISATARSKKTATIQQKDSERALAENAASMQPQENRRTDSQILSCANQPPEEIPVYRVQGLSFSYGTSPVLQNLSFQIHEGEKVAIVGASGGGKTTLFKLLSGLYLPKENRIFFRGQDLAGIPLTQLRENLTVVPQEDFLLQASIRDNVTIAKQEADHRAITEACRKARIDAFIRSRENGYDTEAGSTVQSVSNGQMQRLGLARAFLKDSAVFLLDEPTSALDADTAGLIWDTLFTDCLDKTILVILHDMKEITRFDRILVLNQGEMAGFGTHEELLRGCGVYRQLYRNKNKD